MALADKCLLSGIVISRQTWLEKQNKCLKSGGRERKLIMNPLGQIPGFKCSIFVLEMGKEHLIVFVGHRGKHGTAEFTPVSSHWNDKRARLA